MLLQISYLQISSQIRSFRVCGQQDFCFTNYKYMILFRCVSLYNRIYKKLLRISREWRHFPVIASSFDKNYPFRAHKENDRPGPKIKTINISHSRT